MVTQHQPAAQHLLDGIFPPSPPRSPSSPKDASKATRGFWLDEPALGEAQHTTTTTTAAPTRSRSRSASTSPRSSRSSCASTSSLFSSPTRTPLELTPSSEVEREDIELGGRHHGGSKGKERAHSIGASAQDAYDHASTRTARPRASESRSTRHSQDFVTLPLSSGSRLRLSLPSSPSAAWRVARSSLGTPPTAHVVLALYFALNLSLTLYNKGVLLSFPYPYFLTAIHTGCGVLGCIALRAAGVSFGKSQDPRLAREGAKNAPKDEDELTWRERLTLLAFSALYAANIAVSNASLGLVTVPFHQVVRSTTPLFAIALSYVFLQKRFPQRTLLSLVPVVLGVSLATYGDFYFTAWGLALTLLGTFLAAVKTVATNLLQGGAQGGAQNASANLSVGTRQPGRLQKIWANLTKSAANGYDPLPITEGGSAPKSFLGPRRPIKLHPLRLLELMSPLACAQCLLYSFFSGELSEVSSSFFAQASAASAPLESAVNWSKIFALALNGIVAFGLNVVSFEANRRTGALTMTVAGNIKQVLTIVLAIAIFDLSISPLNQLGIALTLVGGAWYAALELGDKRAKEQRKALARSKENEDEDEEQRQTFSQQLYANETAKQRAAELESAFEERRA